MTRRQLDRRTLLLALAGGSRLGDAAAHDGVDDHPVHAAIEKVPVVAQLRRQLHRARRVIEGQMSDRRAWVRQQDLESAYRSVREGLYFDVGYTFGLVVGRSGSRLSHAARHLAKEVRTLALLAELPPADILAALQETTRAVLSVCAEGKRK